MWAAAAVVCKVLLSISALLALLGGFLAVPLFWTGHFVCVALALRAGYRAVRAQPKVVRSYLALGAAVLVPLVLDVAPRLLH